MRASLDLDGLALERVLLDCCGYTDDTEVDETDGWIRVSTPSSTLANHNMIVRANMTADGVDAGIAAVQRDYGRRKAHYRWLVGPGSTPPDLSQRLAAAGIPQATMLDGMVAEIPNERPAIPAELRFQLVTEADTRQYAELTARGWDRDFADTIEPLSRFMLTCAPILAFQWIVHDSHGPVGTCLLRVLPELGYLQGATVLPHARGRGLYRAMTWYRLARLAERGIGQVVVWANQATSAPIIATLGGPGSTLPSWAGFRTVCSAAIHEV